MNPDATESDEDMKRIIEVLQTQVATMQTELDEVKAQMGEPGEHVGVLGSGAESRVSEPEPETQEEVMAYMKKIPGIGLSKATVLYEAGFDSTEKLKTATAEEFKEISGIGPSLATKMVESIEAIEKGEDLAPAGEPEVESREPKPEGGGAMGFIKGTYGKVMGFFKGKKPEPPAPTEPSEEKIEGETKEEELKPEVAVEEGKETEATEVSEDSKDAEGAITEGSEVSKDAEGAEEPEAEADIPDIKEDEKMHEVVEEEKTEEETEAENREPEPVVEGGVEISAEEPKELTQDDIIKAYSELEGVSDSMAKALFDAGYESFDELKEASAEDLEFIDGIGPKTAEGIVKALKEI
jgi:ERCC4-type nuclease